MTKTFRHYVAAILASMGFALPASATTYSIDYSDLWYNAPAESQAGWGVNIIQQNEVLFVTMFVYGSDGTPRWYVGSNVSPLGTNSFTGPLYSHTGSYFAAPWVGVSPALQVGNITFTFQSDSTGTLTYTVGNNPPITKSIVRQSWRNDQLTGNYIGGTTARGSSCDGNGGILISGELTVTHSHPGISMIVDFVNSIGQSGRCTYSGTYSQVGSLGKITGGTFSCNIGGLNGALVGTFSVAEIANSRNGFNGRFTGQDQYCGYTGFFGGVKDVF